MKDHRYFVYILTNRSRTFYVGVTNDLVRRVAEHRARPPHAFGTRYNIDTLVYFETFTWIRDAIAREKQLKKWSRPRKIALIVQNNPRWQDLCPTDTRGDGLATTYGDPSGPKGPSG